MVPCRPAAVSIREPRSNQSRVLAVPDGAIAATLNRLGKKTRRGNSWTEARVRSFRNGHDVAVYRFLARYRDVGDGIASVEKTEEARRTLGGAVLILDEASMVDLYETRPMVLRAVDRVRWARNDPARELINGQHAALLSIGPANVRMETQDGREIAMRRDDSQIHHLDHAYSSTVHAAQGLTCDRVIAVLDTDRGAADQAMFYVELTRARDNVVLLTDDREALIEALETAPPACSVIPIRE